MLRSLYIQNYALIEKLDISFETGFSVITGETGAGKSIILGAIGLLLGQRADMKAIRRGASKCVIEARFDISAYGMRPFFEENELEYDEECILRREVQASGKSRAFINDTPASLVQVKELGEQLIDVHSQHQNLLLNKEGFQLNVLDILAHNDAALEKYHSRYAGWKQTERELSELMELAENDKRILHLIADSGTGYDELFRHNFPNQIYNFGIAEENMVAVAAGLATTGQLPYVYTSGAFLVYRAIEFIRDDICFQNLNVKFIGMGSGLAWSSLGPTHHTTEEISFLRAIPGLRVFSPATPYEVGACVQAAYEYEGPVYIRIGMNHEEEFFENEIKGRL